MLRINLPAWHVIKVSCDGAMVPLDIHSYLLESGKKYDVVVRSELVRIPDDAGSFD